MNITDDLSRGISRFFIDRGRELAQHQNVKTLRSFKHQTLITFVGYVIYVQSCENLLISFLASHEKAQSLCVAPQNREGGLQKREPEKADSCGVKRTRLALTPGTGSDQQVPTWKMTEHSDRDSAEFTLLP